MDVYANYLYKPPLNKSQFNFYDFNFLTLSMNGAHALAPHNRKFFFNAIEDQFEPIYYDGMLDLLIDLPDIEYSFKKYVPRKLCFL